MVVVKGRELLRSPPRRPRLSSKGTIAVDNRNALRTSVSGTLAEAPSSGGEFSSPECKRAFTSVDNVFRGAGVVAHFRKNTEIYAEADPSEYFYQLHSGAVRTVKFLTNGRRQIGAFHFPGEMFGLEDGPIHCFGAAAICDTTVRIMKRSRLMALAQQDAELAAGLWTLTAAALRHTLEHLLLLGRHTAEERLTSFLLEMAARGSGGRIVELSMSRRDIGDYLDLSLETVSRTFTKLERKAAIDMSTSRRITLGLEIEEPI